MGAVLPYGPARTGTRTNHLAVVRLFDRGWLDRVCAVQFLAGAVDPEPAGLARYRLNAVRLMSTKPKS